MIANNLHPFFTALVSPSERIRDFFYPYVSFKEVSWVQVRLASSFFPSADSPILRILTEMVKKLRQSSPR
jgi:hypothetical protein